jgi:hypothetical protein
MKTLKRVLAIIFALSLLSFSVFSLSSCFGSKDEIPEHDSVSVNDEGVKFYLKLNNDGFDYTIVGISYDTTCDVLNIPSEFEGLNIIAIGPSAFQGKRGVFTKAVIPDTIETIGKAAFYGTTLKEIQIPSSVKTIGEMAFAVTDLEHIALPVTVESIGRGLFMTCTSLQSAYIPENLTVVREMFSSCYALKDVTIENGVDKIELDAFSSCRALETLTVPSSVSKIDAPFFGCSSLREVNFTGSKSDWKRKYVESDGGTEEYHPKFTVKCHDGEISERG